MKRTEEKVDTPGREKTNKPNPTSSQQYRKENPGQIQKDPGPGPKKNTPPHEWQSGKPTEHEHQENQNTERTDVEDEEDETTF